MCVKMSIFAVAIYNKQKYRKQIKNIKNIFLGNQKHGGR